MKGNLDDSIPCTQYPLAVSFYVFPSIYAAVQHERGPRKPKPKHTDQNGRLTPLSMKGDLESPIDLSLSSKSSNSCSPPIFPEPIVSPTFLHTLLAAERVQENPVTCNFDPHHQGEPSAFQVPSHAQLTVRESLQEVTARMLFAIVGWIKQVPSFKSLPSRDQVRINREVQTRLRQCKRYS
jgi:hypothetical protein